MLASLLKGFIAKHTPPVITILLAMAGATFYMGQLINDGFDVMKAEIVSEARQPTYAMLNAQLVKQSEKMDSNPTDIKTSDIKFLYNQCNDDFGKIYITSLPPSEMISSKQICTQLESMYLSRRSY